MVVIAANVLILIAVVVVGVATAADSLYVHSKLVLLDVSECRAHIEHVFVQQHY